MRSSRQSLRLQLSSHLQRALALSPCWTSEKKKKKMYTWTWHSRDVISHINGFIVELQTMCVKCPVTRRKLDLSCRRGHGGQSAFHQHFPDLRGQWARPKRDRRGESKRRAARHGVGAGRCLREHQSYLGDWGLRQIGGWRVGDLVGLGGFGGRVKT